MLKKSKFDFEFLKVLNHLANKTHNPFPNNYINTVLSNSFSDNIFGFHEDLLEKEVRCPICLGRVKNAKRPNKCTHVFCSYCINKWAKTKKKCPICRTEFDKLLKTDIREKFVDCQGNLFA